MRIEPVDAHDDVALAAYWLVTEAAQREGRPYALLEDLAALTHTLRTPSSTYRTELLLGTEDGRPVAAAILGTHLTENRHVADLEVNVHPEVRRRGHGRRMHAEGVRRLAAAGCTTFLAEVYAPGPAGASSGAPVVAPAGVHFAGELGYVSANEEDHLVLDLPATATGTSPAPGWELVTWRNRCPEEHLTAFCDLRTQMEHDVPLGSLDWERVRRTPEVQRESEERMAARYDHLVAAVRRSDDGTFGGYTLVFLPKDSDVVWQDDTLVMPEYRGQRLGLALKDAVLATLAAEFPERRIVHTWTAPDNAAMQRTNAKLGFRAVERMHEMQLKR